MQNLDLLAQEYVLFGNQVAGHSIFIKRIGSQTVFKQACDNELSFYSYVYTNNTKSDQLKKLIEFLPIYFGHQMIQLQGIDNRNTDPIKQKWMDLLIQKRFQPYKQQYIKLEDLTFKYQYPCILDLKIGLSHKNEKGKLKCQKTTSETIGFRICGMNIDQPNNYKIFKDKYWGRDINNNQLLNALAVFLYDKQSNFYLYFIFHFVIYPEQQINIKLSRQFRTKLNQLIEAIIDNKIFRWVSSSLLLMYEGDHHSDAVKLKLIDFANIQKISNPVSPDSELIDSIKSLIDYLAQVEQLEDFNMEEFFN